MLPLLVLAALLAATVTFIAGPVRAQSGSVYHVAPSGNDANPGSAAAPWRTIGRANAALEPGDEVRLHAGTYDDVIRPARSGVSDDVRITYRVAGDGDVILTGFNFTGGPDEGALALGERNYVTVSGRGPGDPEGTQRLILRPTGYVNSYGNVCGSEGVIVENVRMVADAGIPGRGFAFCINFWDGQRETRYNVLRNSYIEGVSSAAQNPLFYTEDLITVAQNAHHNVIENNQLGTVKHSTLYADSPTSHSNVIRNNVIANPEHTALSIYSAGVATADDARFLVEGNVLSASASRAQPDGNGGNALQWGASELIIRHNVITEGGRAAGDERTVGGLSGASGFSYGSSFEANDTRVYNNTIVDNRGPGIAVLDFGGGQGIGGNTFVNNIIHDSHYGSTRYLVEYWDAGVVIEDRWIANGFGHTGGDSGEPVMESNKSGPHSLASAGRLEGPVNPDFSSWRGYDNRYEANPNFVGSGSDAARYGLRPSSPYVDAGAPLTAVASADPGSGRTMRVDDARFFYAEAAEFPDWMGVQGEWIVVGPSPGTGHRVQISSVDDATGTLTLADDVQRVAGDLVWLWADSSGREVISGAAPDLGAVETQTGQPPQPPTTASQPTTTTTSTTTPSTTSTSTTTEGPTTSPTTAPPNTSTTVGSTPTSISTTTAAPPTITTPTSGLPPTVGPPPPPNPEPPGPVPERRTVDFDRPAPSGAPGAVLQGTWSGLDFGQGASDEGWRWEGPWHVSTSNHIYFDSGRGRQRSIAFVDGPRVLDSFSAFAEIAGRLTVSDDNGQRISVLLGTDREETVRTGWTNPSAELTFHYEHGWTFGLDDVVHRDPAVAPDTSRPRVESIAVSPTGVVTGLASDDVGVASVQVAVRNRRNRRWLGDGIGRRAIWHDAILSVPDDDHGGSAWTLAPTLPPGSYVIVVQAFDEAGNRSVRNRERATVR